jgi:hypothetical protein
MAAAKRAAERVAAGFFAHERFISGQSKEGDGLAALGKSDYGAATRLFVEAESEYQGAAQEARQEGERDRQRAPLKASLEQAQATAEARRQQALTAGADRLARELFDHAQARHTEADKLAKQQDLAGAAQAYRDAAERYGEATFRARTAGLPTERPPREMAPFPWPPGPASTRCTIPRGWLFANDGTTTLAVVAGRIEAALRRAEYRKWSYLSAPGGFALVTQMEQINADGGPRPDRSRWSVDLPSVSDMSLVAFVKALAIAPVGSYRVIVFIVTNVPWSEKGAKPTEAQAQQWLPEGVNRLPESMGTPTYGPNFQTDALIYEFRKRHASDAAIFVPVSAVPAETHLQRAGIWSPLSKAQ